MGKTGMIRILFICHGSICRSPMAEYIMKYLVREAGLEDRFRIASAAASREEIGNDIYPPAKRVLAAHGIPYGRHPARQITAQDVKENDLIVAMEEYNLRYMRRGLGNVYEKNAGKFHLLMEYTARPGEVSDPWYTGDFETAYRDIEEGCRGLLARLLRGKADRG